MLIKQDIRVSTIFTKDYLTIFTVKIRTHVLKTLEFNKCMTLLNLNCFFIISISLFLNEEC